jgi:predicted enzyme related to lactoylglutathione lyase
MAIAGIHGVHVYVSDLDAAVAWYRETLGMVVRVDRPMDAGLRWVEVGPIDSATALVLVHGYGQWSAERVGGPTGISLVADNVRATCQDLADRGVVLVTEPRQFPWGWFAEFQDLDGNVLAVGGPE